MLLPIVAVVAKMVIEAMDKRSFLAKDTLLAFGALLMPSLFVAILFAAFPVP